MDRAREKKGMGKKKETERKKRTVIPYKSEKGRAGG